VIWMRGEEVDRRLPYTALLVGLITKPGRLTTCALAHSAVQQANARSLALLLFRHAHDC
jgi:hypothetical protein